jgi:peroxiredoxin Q/BCP
MITLKEGDRAPLFSGHDQDGKPISLTDYAGETLVLFFYSEAGSPTCTIESCNLRDHFREIKAHGLEVVGISPDNQKAQKKFEQKYRLPYRLIADVNHTIADAYGTRDMKKLFGREYMGILRTTFIIDGEGVILKIFHKPKNKVHAQEILDALNAGWK